MFSSGWQISSNFLNQIYFGHALIVTLIGLTMNIIVILRMRRLYQRNPDQYRNGIGICLFVMSLADLISLCSLFVQFINVRMPVAFNELLQNFMCKILAFSSHICYTQSMYALAIMSSLRYQAIKRPLEYKILWRIPFIAMSCTLVLAILLNAWILIDVSYVNGQCVQSISAITKTQKLADVVLSFFVPTILVLYMDLSVLCCRIESPFSDPMLQIVVNRPNAEKLKSLRFLAITISCILLNFPENFLRFGAALGLPFVVGQEAIPQSILVLAKAMYFSQFAFKSFYLTTFVYDRSVLSKTNSSRQLSISFRQRLEESSHNHMIRERAATMSYRASTPLPQIQRNSSCAALDQLMPGKYSF